MDQPVPKVSRQDVERVVRRDFATEDFDTVLSLLDEYGHDSSSDGRARVHLAILKLSGGSVDMLLREIEQANSDYRDVLSPAEYPDYPWDAAKLPKAAQERIIQADWKQYDDWLKRS